MIISLLLWSCSVFSRLCVSPAQSLHKSQQTHRTQLASVVMEFQKKRRPLADRRAEALLARMALSLMVCIPQSLRPEPQLGSSLRAFAGTQGQEERDLLVGQVLGSGASTLSIDLIRRDLTHAVDEQTTRCQAIDV